MVFNNVFDIWVPIYICVLPSCVSHGVRVRRILHLHCCAPQLPFTTRSRRIGSINRFPHTPLFPTHPLAALRVSHDKSPTAVLLIARIALSLLFLKHFDVVRLIPFLQTRPFGRCMVTPRHKSRPVVQVHFNLFS